LGVVQVRGGDVKDPVQRHGLVGHKAH